MQLSHREKIAVSAAVACLVLFTVMQLVVFPLVENRTRLKKSIISREKQLVEMKAMASRHEQLGKKNNEMAALLEKRPAEFSLFSFLEGNAAKSNVKERIAYMKPSELTDDERLRQSMVEMKLQAVGIKQLVSFLEKTESPEHLVGIQRMVVQENTRDKGTLDATLQIVSIDEVLKTMR